MIEDEELLLAHEITVKSSVDTGDIDQTTNLLDEILACLAGAN